VRWQDTDELLLQRARKGLPEAFKEAGSAPWLVAVRRQQGGSVVWKTTLTRGAATRCCELGVGKLDGQGVRLTRQLPGSRTACLLPAEAPPGQAFRPCMLHRHHRRVIRSELVAKATVSPSACGHRRVALPAKGLSGRPAGCRRSNSLEEVPGGSASTTLFHTPASADVSLTRIPRCGNRPPSIKTGYRSRSRPGTCSNAPWRPVSP